MRICKSLGGRLSQEARATILLWMFETISIAPHDTREWTHVIGHFEWVRFYVNELLSEFHLTAGLAESSTQRWLYLAAVA